MRLKNLTITMVAAMALAAANTAFAIVICGPPNDLGGGEVTMFVQIQMGLSEDATFNATGPVTADVSNCTSGATNCTVTAQGTPGGGPQLVVFEFTEIGDPSPPSECEVTRADGLPVELNKFSVE